MNNEKYALIKQSYGRVVGQSGFIARFYEVFMNSSPEVKRRFQETDFDRQYEALEQSLTMALLFSEGNAIAKQSLSKVRKSHARNELDISPELYKFWIDSLMQVFGELDPYFTGELEQQWRDYLQFTLDYISGGY